MNERVKEIFSQALAQKSAAGRERFLAEACGEDAVLRREVESLLAAHRDARQFLQAPIAGGAASKTMAIPSLVETAENRIGRYKLLERIGEGGMGVVWMAEQEEPVRRRVALKIIKLGMDTKEVVARFEAERQALAMMDHPNIASVFDGGATETGRPYFVMELVKGIPITDYCNANNLPTSERLRLFMKICQAVQHAHQKGVIHRDLKPSNILVTVKEDRPVPKVIDFGVAKATQARLTEKTLFTQFRQLIGTPAYMSPEQAGLGSLDVDTRSDIYALGVLLYELLTDRIPFDTQKLLEKGCDAVLRAIREDEPPKPSARLSTLQRNELITTAQHRQAEPPKLIHLIRGDLDWIVMKTLEKDRTRRYETVNGLALDIQRHLNHEPVVARPPSNFYRVEKWVRRNRLAFAAGNAVAASLLLGVTLSSWLFFKERAAHQQARAALGREMIAERTQATLRQQAQDAAMEAKKTLAASDFWEANRLIDASSGSEAVAYLSRILSADPANEAALTRLAMLLSFHSWMVPTLIWHPGGKVVSVDFSPDGKRIATALSDNTAQVWDAQTGQPLAQPLKDEAGVIFAQFSPDGQRLVTASWANTARVWDAQTGQPLTAPLKHGARVTSARFSPDGQRVVTISFDGAARVWDARTGRQLTETLTNVNERNLLCASFSPDGQRLVTVSSDGSKRVWNAQNGQPLTEPLKLDISMVSAEFSQDTTRTLTTSADNLVRVWNAQTGQPLTEPLKLGSFINSVRFSPDATRFLTSAWDNTVRVWDEQTGEPLIEPLKLGTLVSSAEFSPDDLRMVTASNDGTVRVWNEETGQPLVVPLKIENRVISAGFSPDGERIITSSEDGTARVWDAQTGQPLTAPLRHRNGVSFAEFSPDGKRVATASQDETARVWDAQTGQPLAEPVRHSLQVVSVHFSPDGKRIVTASNDKTARVWNAETGQPLAGPLQHGRGVASAEFSPDGRRVVTASYDFTARVWDAQTGQPLTDPLEHSSSVLGARFSPDGKRIVTAACDNTARVWDAQTGQPLTGPLPHGNQVNSAEFSPDGKRVATASNDNTACLWDAQTGQLLAQPLRHSREVNSARFSPDGKRLVTASADGTARVWDAQTGQPLSELLKHGSAVTSVRFSPDGQRIVTTSSDGIARVWDVGFAPLKCPDWLLPLAEALSGSRLNQQGLLEPTSLDRAETITQIWQTLKHLPDNGDGVLWGRWLLADRSTRAILPFTGLTTPTIVEPQSHGISDRGAARDADGATPLHWAALMGQADEVNLLVTNQAEVNARNNDGETPLLWAAYTGHKRVVELLLAGNAEVNAGDRSGITPLHAAAQYGYRYLVELLLTHKAEVNAESNGGETPLDFAAAMDHADVVELLRQHGGHNGSNAGQIAAEASKPHSVQQDLGGIQGTWKLIAMEANGRQAPPETVAVMKLNFAGDTLTFTPGEPGFTHFEYVLDPTVSPAGFAMTHADDPKKGQTSNGIYWLEGDRLKICFGRADRRPDELTARAGSGQMMYSLQREK